jgi:hypothetical protein
MDATQRIITDTDKAPLIQVVTLMLLVVGIMSCLVRSCTKYYMIKTLKADDLLTIASCLFAIGQTTAIFVSCEHALGKLFELLTPASIEVFYHTQYAAKALFIASLLCSKLASAMSLRMMTREKRLWVVLVCEIIVVVWGISALFVSLFECHLPSPWDTSDPSRCIDRMSFWTYFSAANIATDGAILLVLMDNVRRIQTSWRKKALVIGVFGSRVLVVPAAVAQLIYTTRALSSSSDPTFSPWQASICASLVQCLSILTVCLPNLKPFLDNLESGQIRVDDLRRQGKSRSDGYPSYQYPRNRSGQTSGNSNSNSNSKSRDNTRDEGILSTGARDDDYEMAEMGGGGKPKHTQKKSWDGNSHSSQTILIQQTWQVDVQRAPSN